MLLSDLEIRDLESKFEAIKNKKVSPFSDRNSDIY